MRSQLLQTFDAKYTSYCDFVQFVTPVYLKPEPHVQYFLVRGVELLGEDNDVEAGTARAASVEQSLLVCS